METKICTKCKEAKSLDCFSKSKYYSDGFAIYCKPCRVKLQRKTFLNNPETQRTYKRKWHKAHRQQVLLHYCCGDIKCAKCGFADERALSVDHIDGNGSEHRRQLKSESICRWLVKNNFPNGFQILCMNCQFIKRVENGEESPRAKATLKDRDDDAA